MSLLRKTVTLHMGSAQLSTAHSQPRKARAMPVTCSLMDAIAQPLKGSKTWRTVGVRLGESEDSTVARESFSLWGAAKHSLLEIHCRHQCVSVRSCSSQEV
jgi:hypothetical protein